MNRSVHRKNITFAYQCHTLFIIFINPVHVVIWFHLCVFFVFLKEGKSSLGKFFKQGPWKSQSTQINLDDEEDGDEEEDIDDETLTHHIAIKSVMIGSMRTMAEGPMVIDKMGVCMRVKCKSFFFIHCCSYYSIVNIFFGQCDYCLSENCKD